MVEHDFPSRRERVERERHDPEVPHIIFVAIPLKFDSWTIALREAGESSYFLTCIWYALV